jgi:D-alanyl-D-alanine carboxypeptidase
VAGFVRWMNDQVAEWGLQNTRFANPHGLDAKDNYTTAYEMAIITRYAIAEPTFAEIVRLPEWIVNHRVVKSTNELLNAYPGMIGVKTGTTDEAGENLITIVDRPAGQALTVVMGSTDRYRDTRLLLDYYYANYAELHVSLPDTAQSRYLDAEGNWHTLELRAPQTYLVKPWQMENVRLYRRIDQRATSPSPDEPVGVLEVHVASERLAEVPMYAR